MGATNNADEQNHKAIQEIADQKNAALASLQQYLSGHPNPMMGMQAPTAPQQFSGAQGGGIAQPNGQPPMDPQQQAMMMRALQMRMQQQAQTPGLAQAQHLATPPQMPPQQQPPQIGLPPAQPGAATPPGGPQPGILGLLHG